MGGHAGRAELEGPKETERQDDTGKQGFQNCEARLRVLLQKMEGHA
jgi:hypothetical protein